MGRIQKIALTLGTVFAVLGISAGVAFAAKDATVSGVTNHTVYKAGSTVNITGTVNGDIFCAGQSVNIDAVVNGDVICAGQTVTVNGTVNGNIRVAGQSVNINAKIRRNASVAGQTVDLGGNASISGDLGMAVQTASIDGPVGRDLRAGANTLTLNNKIKRNVDATVNKLHLKNGANIGGDIVYTSPHKLIKDQGASIGGQISYHTAKERSHGKGNSWRGLWLAKTIYLSIALLVFSLVLTAIFPQTFAAWNKRSKAQPWLALLTGFIAMFVVPVLFVALLVTIVGAPLALLLMLAWMALVLLSAPVSAYYLGSLILPAEKRVPLIVLLGAVVLGIISLIPVLGDLVTIVAIWFGTGSLLLNLRRYYKKPVYTT